MRPALAALVLLCAASASAEPYDLTADQKATVEANIRSRLLDPQSAIFDIMKAGKFGPMILACGLVNSKNRFGGYAGDHVFMGEFQTWGFDGDVAQTDNDTDYMIDRCKFFNVFPK